MPDLGPLNGVDYAVLAILLFSGVKANFRGMTRELLGLAGWAVAILATRFLSPRLVERFGDFLGIGSPSELMGFAVPFVVVLAAWYLLSNLISPGLTRYTFGIMDRALGFLFGIVRGVVVVTLVYIGGLMLLEDEAVFPGPVLDSASILPARALASQLVLLAPDDIRASMEERIPEQDIKKLLGIGLDAADEAAGNLRPDEQLPVPGK